MSSKHYTTEEFKIETVKQITVRGYSVHPVPRRLGVTTHSHYIWCEKYGEGSEQATLKEKQQAEIRCLGADLKRVTEEREILKKHRILCKRVPVIYAFIRNDQIDITTRSMCRMMRVHRTVR